MKHGRLEVRHCRTAKEFVDGVAEFGGCAGLMSPIFRGQADATKQLVPKVLRPGQCLSLERNNWGRLPAPTVQDQLIAEAYSLRAFFDLADSRGLALPEDSQRLRAVLRDLVRRLNDSEYLDRLSAFEEAWPPDELLSLCGLAQHYGVPTRLLDWTRSGWVAAYFAAADAAVALRAKRLGVWAVSTTLVQLCNQNLLPERLSVVTAPAAGNPNLRAQQALFLVDRGVGDARGPVRVTPIDALVQKLAPNGKWPVLHLVTLPTALAVDALQLLSDRGVDASAIYPGYAGVAMALREWQLAADDEVDTGNLKL